MYRNLLTDEIISDEEVEEACAECFSYYAEYRKSVECEHNRENCPYFKRISKTEQEVEE